MVAMALWIGLLSLHPFYIGVSEIEYKEKSKTFQISIKLFVDDVMTELNSTSKLDFDPTLKNSASNNRVLSDFVQRGFSIKTSNTCNKLPQAKALDLNFIGWELEEGAIWLHLESNGTCLSCLEINNRLLCHSIKEQIHILKFIRNGKVYSDRFVCPNVWYQIKF